MKTKEEMHKQKLEIALMQYAEVVQDNPYAPKHQSYMQFLEQVTNEVDSIYFSRNYITCKCEDCDKEERYIDKWPEGWTQCGTSKHAEVYSKNSFAWHCPECHK